MRQGVNLEARNAFARVPFPEYWNLDPVQINMDGCTQEAYDAVDRRAIADLLRAGDTDFSLSAPNATSTGFIVVSALEYKATPKSPEALSKQARARTSAALPGRTHDNGIRASERSGAHVLKGYVPKLEGLITTASGKVDELKALKPEITYYWYSHMPEEKMRKLASGVFFGVQDVLEVAAQAHSWSAQDLEDAKRAAIYRLIGGERKRPNFEGKKQYWADMSGLMVAYNSAKVIVFGRKREQCLDIIARRMTAASR